MNADHILRMFTLYRAAFPARLSPEDRALFYGYTGYWLFTLYDLVPPEARPALRPFVFRAWREGLYRPAMVARLRPESRSLDADGRCECSIVL